MIVKICGLTSLEDARVAAEAGADMLGFLFYPPSPRFVPPDRAAGIIREIRREFPSVRCVGVLVNEPLETIRHLVALCGLDMVQLHGDESPAEVDALMAEGIAVIKGFRLRDDRVLEMMSRYRPAVYLVDAYHPDRPGGTGQTCDWELAARARELGPLLLAGGLMPENVAEAIRAVHPWGVDVASGVEAAPGRKDPDRVRQFVQKARSQSGEVSQDIRAMVANSVLPSLHNLPDERGYFGPYGGKFVPETLMPALEELETAYREARSDPAFQAGFRALLRDYVGRPTPLYFARRLTESCGGARIYLKREDLAHTGAHKINNTLGQALLARRMGKRRLVAETGAGQHGVATATVAALLGMECVVYMGTEDMRRQAPNVERMRLLGAEVRGVDAGSRTLKDAINEAIRDWVTHVRTTHYLLGSVLGPHPYPMMIRDFQSVIGQEARAQILEAEGRLPDVLIACVGGGSNAMGLFHAFLGDPVAMVGVEAGGLGLESGMHAARFSDPRRGRVGVLHGTRTYVLQNEDGQILTTHSISAGLDYPAVGPEHSYLRQIGRVTYTTVSDEEALEAFDLLCRLEGIIPALESAHALAEAVRRAREMAPEQILLVNLSGRGDKDLETVLQARGGGR